MIVLFAVSAIAHAERRRKQTETDENENERAQGQTGNAKSSERALLEVVSSVLIQFQRNATLVAKTAK